MKNEIIIKDKRLSKTANVGQFTFYEGKWYKVLKVYTKKTVVIPATDVEIKKIMDEIEKEKRIIEEEARLDKLKETDPKQYKIEIEKKELEKKKRMLKARMTLLSLSSWFGHSENPLFTEVKKKNPYGMTDEEMEIEKQIQEINDKLK